MNRTLEQLIKFDSGLPIGESLVLLTAEGKSRKALISIGKRGKVSILTEPYKTDMYNSIRQVKGNDTNKILDVIAWWERDAKLMDRFRGKPLTTIDVEQYRKP